MGVEGSLEMRTDAIELSVILPVFNEAGNISDLYRDLEKHLHEIAIPYEIIFVDDGSVDESWQKIKEVERLDPNRVRCFRLAQNLGQSAAIYLGLQKSSGETIILLDADRQNDPADFRHLLNTLNGGYDFVCGWRKNRKDNYWLRVLPSVIANLLIRKIFYLPFHDIGCTLKCFRRNVLQRFDYTIGDFHRYMAILVYLQGARVTELEVRHYPRVWGKSNYGFTRIFKVVRDIMRIRIGYR